MDVLLYKLFHSVIDQIIKSLNNGTLYFPFGKTARTLLIKDYANSLTNSMEQKSVWLAHFLLKSKQIHNKL